MFTPLHGTISLIAAGIVLDYALRIVGVMMFKTLEVLGKRRAKAGKSSNGKNCTPNFLRKGGQDDEKEDSYFERTRTANSSMTAVDESCPFRSNRQFNEALRENYRIPGA